MAGQIIRNIDFAQTPLKNAALDCLPAAPTSPVKGQVYYNTADDIAYIYIGGGVWRPLSADEVSVVIPEASKSVTMNVTSSWTNIDIESIRSSIPTGLVAVTLKVTTAGQLSTFTGVMSWRTTVANGTDEELLLNRIPESSSTIQIYLKLRRTDSGSGPCQIAVASTGSYIGLSFDLGFKQILSA